jgi:hypothetical protein
VSTVETPAPLVSVAEAEQLAGFDAKELPSVPKGFTFVGAMAGEGGISIQYQAQGNGGQLIINESTNGFMESEWDQAPVEAISQVRIGELDAEIVQGAYVVYPGETVACWNPDVQILRLRWISEGLWFEMAKFGGVESIAYLDKAGLIALAKNMVYEPDEDQSLSAEPASSTELPRIASEPDPVVSVSISEAEKVTLFAVKVLPSALQGMVFVGATATQSSINIQYESLVKCAGLLSISQSLHAENWKQVPADAVTFVRVGDMVAEFIRGDYVFLPGDPSGTWNAHINSVHLRWVENGVRFVISMYAGGVGSLAHLDQAGPIALAESMMYTP